MIDPRERCAGCGGLWVYGDVVPRTGALCRPGCAERYEELLSLELGVPPDRHAATLTAQHRTWPTLRELERAHGASL